MVGPVVGADAALDHAAGGAAGVDHPAPADVDAHMAGGFAAAGEHQDVALLELVHIVDPREFAAGPPADAGHVADVHPRLLQAPVDETGAVEAVRALTAPHVGATHAAFGGFNEALYPMAVVAAAMTGFRRLRGLRRGRFLGFAVGRGRDLRRPRRLRRLGGLRRGRIFFLLIEMPWK